MKSGLTQYGRELLAVPAVRTDGSSVSVEFSMVLLRGSANRIVGTVAGILDVTEGWQREKALKKRLQELLEKHPEEDS